MLRRLLEPVKEPNIFPACQRESFHNPVSKGREEDLCLVLLLALTGPQCAPDGHVSCLDPGLNVHHLAVRHTWSKQRTRKALQKSFQTVFQSHDPQAQSCGLLNRNALHISSSSPVLSVPGLHSRGSAPEDAAPSAHIPQKSLTPKDLSRAAPL